MITTEATTVVTTQPAPVVPAEEQSPILGLLDHHSALYELERQKGAVRDRVRDVAMHRATSVYIFGPPGTSKTYMVRHTLDDISVPYHYHAGHLTPMGYFDLLKEHADEIIVIDDVTSLFRDRIGQQLLLASLGTGYSGDWTRIVRYQQRNTIEEVHFSGGLIAISNAQLHDTEVMSAIKSRTRPLRWDPSQAQLAAMMRNAVKDGWKRNPMSLTAQECSEVVEFIIDHSHRYSAPLDLRLFFDGTLPDYWANKEKEHETDWRDHVLMGIRERIGRLQYSGPAKSRAEQKQLEQRIVEQIRATHNTRPEQVMAWAEATGKSERAYDRRSAELRIAK